MVEIGFNPYGANLVGGRHLLQGLGLDPYFFQELDQYQDQVATLRDLQDQFSMAAAGMSPIALAGWLQSGGIPGAFAVPPPNVGGCGCPQYYAPQTFDFG